MALTYTTTKTYTERVERTIQVRDEWGMYTSAGNRSLRMKAERLVEKVEKIREDRRNGKFHDSSSRYRTVFAAFFRGWRKMHYCKSYGESSDTAVREMVWGFAMDIACDCLGYSHDWLDEIWESRAAHPKK